MNQSTQTKIEAEQAELARLRAEAVDLVRKERESAERATHEATVSALVMAGVSEDMARLAVTAIAQRKIPAVTISYRLLSARKEHE